MPRNTLFAALIAALVLLLPCGAHAAPQDGLRPVCISISQRGGLPFTAPALLAEGSVWVPAETLQQHLQEYLALDPADRRAYLSVDPAQFKLETAALDVLLSSGATLNFPTRQLQGQAHLELGPLAKLLGLAWAADGEQPRQVTDGPYRDAHLNHRRPAWQPAGKIILAWDHIKDDGAATATAPCEGPQVLSPTWFSIAASSGLVLSKADRQYVDRAHQAGLKVWALVDNSFDAALTRTLLADAYARENVVKQLVLYAALYDLDGLNFDFENVDDADRDRLTQFVRELAAALKEQNLVVSVDVTVPNTHPSWSNCYDRRQLAASVDYVMVMTYDEYWATKTPGGPVASLPWVEAGVRQTLAEVPPHKLLLGLPFYTKLWEEAAGGRPQGRTLSMADVEALLQKQRPPVLWRPDQGLHYAAYTAAGKQYHLWIEDETSLALKAGLVRPYQLAGIACWRRGFEQPQVWPALRRALAEG